MATNYPGSLDTGTEQPSPLSTTEMDDAGFEHDVVHTNHSGAIIALETKVGTGSSTAVADSVLAGTGAGASGWSTAPSLAGLTVDTSTLHVDATNDRVGVGTASPSKALHVNGGTVNAVALFESTDATVLINLQDSDSTDANQVFVKGSGDDLRLGAGGSDLIHLDGADQRVGIGTTAPDSLLHLDTSATASAELLRLSGTWSGSGGKFGYIVGETNSDGGVLSAIGLGVSDNSANANDGGIVFQTTSGATTNVADLTTRMVIDHSGNVGIGTTAPENQLHVVGDALFEDASPLLVLRDNNSTTNISGNIQFKDQADTVIAQIFMGSTDDLRVQSSQIFYVSAQGAYRVRVDSTGLRPYADNTYDCGTATLRWDDVFATNGTIQTSDQRDKTSITDLDLGLDFINDLRPVSFVWNDRGGYNGTRKHMGFIAQEVASSLGDQASDRAVWINSPAESVKMEDGTFEDIPDRQGIRYEELIAPLVKAVQQLSARVAALEAA